MNSEILGITDEGVWVKCENGLGFITFESLYPKCVIDLNINLDDYDEPLSWMDEEEKERNKDIPENEWVSVERPNISKIDLQAFISSVKEVNNNN